jgi:hypothetical protein
MLRIHMTIAIPSHLSDGALIAEVTRRARDERHATAQLVAHLAELDARRLHLGAGHSSLFAYCRDALGLTEDAAYNRVEAARACRLFPQILDRLVDGALTVTSVRLLARHLTAENHRELLAAASRRSKREVEELIAHRFPKPDNGVVGQEGRGADVVEYAGRAHTARDRHGAGCGRFGNDGCARACPDVV